MEPARDTSESVERQVSPTVSKDKWILHARQKMAKGYVLIVSPTRRTANFFMRGKGFEMCAFKVARTLIQLGMVEEAGTHRLGMMYRLKEEHMPPVSARPPAPKPPPADADPETETVDLPDFESEDAELQDEE
ncbi:MAG: hypothetical protein F6K04_04995 [Leptolyngbya sp. SIO4C5]|nr:hypothetical protein [Leptolyngbya sp. SIO4C5]